MTRPPIDVDQLMATVAAHQERIAALTLAPCPFCGGSDTTLIKTLTLWYVLCAPACSACGPTADTPEQAAALWNARTELRAARNYIALLEQATGTSIQEIRRLRAIEEAARQYCAINGIERYNRLIAALNEVTE